MFAFGSSLVVTLFGESHGLGVGVVVDGLPPGVPVSLDRLARALVLRRPTSAKLHTSRREPDAPEIRSGVLDGRATGAPIHVWIPNQDVDSAQYLQRRDIPRPGHADWTRRVKYGGWEDFRGGGTASGRMTAGLVAAGALVSGWLEPGGVDILAWTHAVGERALSAWPESANSILRPRVEQSPVRCPDLTEADRLIQLIEAVRQEGDSIGGIVRARVEGLPTGLGEPFFDSAEATLAHLLFSVPAVKALGFGSGFRAHAMRGSEHNDAFEMEPDGVRTKTNHAGGILGGITTGMPLEVEVVFKPAASIARPQETLNVLSGQQTVLEVRGRFDPCIVPRAVPVVEACLWLGIGDLWLQRRQPKPRDGCENELDQNS